MPVLHGLRGGAASLLIMNMKAIAIPSMAMVMIVMKGNVIIAVIMITALRPPPQITVERPSGYVVVPAVELLRLLPSLPTVAP